jgi:hypothetical protein
MSVFVMYLIGATLADMARTQKPKRGRPAHTDDPPKLLSTSIPTSVDEMLREMSDKLNRPRSELLADAIRAYARRYPNLKSIKK